MRIFAKIRQVYDRLCERKEASADRMRQERDARSNCEGAPSSSMASALAMADEASTMTRRWRQLAV